jgi:hypothetical protein
VTHSENDDDNDNDNESGSAMSTDHLEFICTRTTFKPELLHVGYQLKP